MNADKKAKPIIQQPAQGTSTNGTGDQSAAQPLQEATKKERIDALRQNWQREVEGMRTYRDLARRERDTARRNVLLKLAEAEERHAQKWERKLAELGTAPPPEERSPGTRFKGWLRPQLGTQAPLPPLDAQDDRDIP